MYDYAFFIVFLAFYAHNMYCVQQKCYSSESNKKIATARTVFDRVREERVYPDVQPVKLSMMHTVTDVPEGFNGPHGDPIIMKFANIIDVIKGLLKRTSVHQESDDNLVWEPERVYENGRRIFTRHASSGLWWSAQEVPRGPFVVPSSRENLTEG